MNVIFPIGKALPPLCCRSLSIRRVAMFCWSRMSSNSGLPDNEDRALKLILLTIMQANMAVNGYWNGAQSALLPAVKEGISLSLRITHKKGQLMRFSVTVKALFCITLPLFSKPHILLSSILNGEFIPLQLIERSQIPVPSQDENCLRFGKSADALASSDQG